MLSTASYTLTTSRFAAQRTGRRASPTTCSGKTGSPGKTVIKMVTNQAKRLSIKKRGSLFDATMGSFYGPEICELVGLYLLHNLCNPSQNAEHGLYRDDGLAVARNASGPIVDKIKKKIIKIFQQHNLKITTEANLFQTDFLDVTFNLDTGKYWLYRKPEN